MFKLEAKNLDLFYGSKQALKNISMGIKPNTVSGFIGPSGGGKSTLLRCSNRMNDLIENVRIEWEVLIDGRDIYHSRINLDDHRKKIGMVFQKPNPFPKSIFENVAYGLRINGVTHKKFIVETVERSLRQADLWEEVKDNLNTSELALSGGQQHSLCIARALAVEPTVVLMDEQATALDPVSTRSEE